MLIDLYSKSGGSSRVALMATMTFIALMGSYNWLIEPHVQNLEAAQRYANEISNFAKKNKMIEGKMKIKQLRVDKLSKQVAEIQEQVFTAAAAQQLFASLEIFAKETNCVITSLNQLPDKTAAEGQNAFAGAGITAHSASVNLVGDYSNIVKFLTLLLDRQNKVIISPFSISVRQDNSEKLECSLILTIYVINDDNSEGADPNAQ